MLFRDVGNGSRRETQANPLPFSVRENPDGEPARPIPSNDEAARALTRAEPKPFVKWAGGKRSLVPTLKRYLPRETFGTYFEPFVGGGALFFALRSRIDKAALSDMNIELMIAYKIIQQRPQDLLTCLREHQRRHSREYYYEVRKEEPTDPVQLAARFIYLNRTCYNGLYRVNQSGRFNVPLGKYQDPVIADETNIPAVSCALQGVTPARQSFDRIQPAARDFVYCDPPYDGTYDQYTDKRFAAAEQKSLETTARAWGCRGVKVMLSNADTLLIRSLYQPPMWRVHEVNAPRVINRQGSRRQPITELVITNYDI